MSERCQRKYTVYVVDLFLKAMSISSYEEFHREVYKPNKIVAETSFANNSLFCTYNISEFEL